MTTETADTPHSPPASYSMELWQKEFAAMAMENRIDRPGYLRLSQTGQCQRKLHYTHAGELPSNPTNQERRNKLAMGHALEVLAIISFREHGWETRYTCLDDGGQLTVETSVDGLSEPVSGHPDGICRHPQFTNDKWIPLEVKSMPEFRAEKVEELGLAKVEPSYVMQIAMYGRLLFDQGLTEHHDRGVFAIITREGRMLAPELLKWRSNLSDAGHQRLATAVYTNNQGEPPERPYDDPNHEPCSYCQFRDLCWGNEILSDLQPIIRGQATEMDHDPEAVQAAQDWARAKQLMDQSKSVLEAKLAANGNIPIAAAGVKAEYFRPNEANNYDMAELGRYLTGQIMRQHQNPQRPNRVLWVHHI